MTSDTSDTSAAGSPPDTANNNSATPANRGSGASDKIKMKKKTQRSDSTATVDSNPPAKVTKRRAARACVSCRARKVRCNVVEESPCTNCRFDNVECIVQESRRRKKHLLTANIGQHAQPGSSNSSSNGSTARPGGAALTAASATPHGHHHHHPIVPIHSAAELDMRRPSSGSALSSSDAEHSLHTDGHVPHMLCYRTLQAAVDKSQQQTQPQPQPQPQTWPSASASTAAASAIAAAAAAQKQQQSRTAQFLSQLEDPDASSHLPAFVRPLPARIAAEDVTYLHIKGALSLPAVPLQNALLQAYIEYVDPYMPLMDMHDFLDVVNRRDGLNGQTSLFLYQAVMFAATAFVDVRHLREAGYPSRKVARKAFFQKTRLLYDFDYETDRLVLVQGLMLMTYWYETPDDQKDTWHWMGVAISLAHTIGLHRNPASTTMAASKQKLWKRIWWSCFMRDRLIALGMRRPTRIKDEDFDVPMLDEADFEIRPLADNITVVPGECVLARDVGMQRELATLCIQKAKLCLCISKMLKAQYSVLIRDSMKPENTTNSTMMLFPNKQLDNVESINSVDEELSRWADALPADCRYRTPTAAEAEGGRATLAVQRTLLHMVYYTTISALHRPQFLPSSPAHAPTTSRQTQDMSRVRVRDAATHITAMAAELHALRLERFLPTTGVTVILPAMIIHLLEMKSASPEARDHATKGFRQCMLVMEKLREIYAAADYATGFLDAALRKASIDVHSATAGAMASGAPGQQQPQPMTRASAMVKQSPVEFSAQTPPPENVPYMTASETLFNEPPPAATAAPRAMRQASFASPGSASAADLRKAMAPPHTINAADLDLTNPKASASPPSVTVPNDLVAAAAGMGPAAVAAAVGAAGMPAVVTPSASAGSEEMGAGEEGEAMDLDFMQGHDEFDWNAVAGTDFDVDQWLQFPPDGVSAAAEDVNMGGAGAAATTAGGAPVSSAAVW